MTQSGEKTYTFVFIQLPADLAKRPSGDSATANIVTGWQQLWQTLVGLNFGTAIEPLGLTETAGLEAACFEQATQALKAVIQLQEGLRREQPELAKLAEELRIGLYTGPAQAQNNNNFFGPTINRLSRLLQLAQPGQILLGASTEQAITPKLSQFEGISLSDLGQHSLRSMVRPENIYQLVMPGLFQNFSQSQPSNGPATNLPVPTDPLIGREVEEKTVGALLTHPEIRLVTLTGLSGAGKTRLALEVGRTLLENFKDGVFMVRLSALRDPGLLTSAVAQVLGVREQGGGAQALLDGLVAHLRSRSLLLLLDSFEQLVSPAAGEWLTHLLNNAPGLKVLITSQRALGLLDEHEYDVPPLVLPNRQGLTSAGQLGRYPSVQLFVQRARQADPDFTVNDTNATAVAELVNELEGIPLAIELTAVRSKLFSTRTILNQLSTYLDEVKNQQANQKNTSSSTALLGTLGWSFGLLEADEKRVFTRLAVFAGGCTAKAAAEVVNFKGDLRLDVTERLEMLISKGFVQRSQVKVGGKEETRYSLLEAVREYGLKLLAERGELESAMQAYTGYYMRLAHQAAPALVSDEQSQWLERLALEHDNFRAALDWLLQNDRNAAYVEIALRLATDLGLFWSIRGYLSEGRKWLEHSLNRAEALEANLLSKEVLAAALKAIGTLSNEQADYPAGQRYYEQSLVLLRELGDQTGIARLLNNLGIVAREQGNYETARRLFEESLAHFRELKNNRAVASLLNNLGLFARNKEDYALARQFLEEGVAIARQQEDRSVLGVTLSSLGDVALDQYDYSTVRKCLAEGLVIYKELNDQKAIAFILEYYAGLAAALKQSENALQLAGAAEQLRELTEAPLSQADQLVLERRLQPAREALGQVAVVAWQAGSKLTLEQAIALAKSV